MKVKTLEELLTALRELPPIFSTDQLITDLPTFGGDAPADTAGIWSWDESRLLVGTCIDDMEIVERD